MQNKTVMGSFLQRKTVSTATILYNHTKHINQIYTLFHILINDIKVEGKQISNSLYYRITTSHCTFIKSHYTFIEVLLCCNIVYLIHIKKALFLTHIC